MPSSLLGGLKFESGRKSTAGKAGELLTSSSARYFLVFMSDAEPTMCSTQNPT